MIARLQQAIVAMLAACPGGVADLGLATFASPRNRRVPQCWCWVMRCFWRSNS
jgi:hypothetical protein